MKTTTGWITGWLTLTIGILGQVALAQQPLELGAMQSTRATIPADRTESEAAILSARRALARGDVAVARQHLNLSIATHAGQHYLPHEDSPAKLTAAIERYEQLMANQQDTPQWRRQYALSLTEQSVALIHWKELSQAEQLATTAVRLGVEFAPHEPNPHELIEQIRASRRTQPAQPQSDHSLTIINPHLANAATTSSVEPALHNPAADPTSNTPASSAMSVPEERHVTQDQHLLDDQPQPTQTSPDELPPTGELPYESLQRIDPPRALDASDDLIPPPAGGEVLPNGATPPSPMMQNIAEEQLVLARQLATELGHVRMESKKIRKDQPRRALKMLEQVRVKVAKSGLDDDTRGRLLRRADLDIADMEKYIEQHRAEIELDDANRAVLSDVERRQQHRVEVGNEVARLVDQFNRLVDEQRYEEAEVMAKRARDIAPEEQVVQQIWRTALLIRRDMLQRRLRDEQEQGVWNTIADVDISAAPPVSTDPYQLPDVKEWGHLTKQRTEMTSERSRQMNQREYDIYLKLRSPVLLNFKDTPLSEVIAHLQDVTGVNMHLDQVGLSLEGVVSDTPITFDIKEEIQLRSALNLILEPLRLGYVIKDEVLKITSEELKDGQIIQRVYPVADLVIPIPNFTAGNQMGLQSAINAAHQTALGAQAGLGFVAGGPIVGATGSLASRQQGEGQMTSGVLGSGGTTSAGVLANVPGAAGQPLGPGSAGFAGPGGALGGGTEADFESIIELITGTIQPETWEEVGGPGSIREFENNLSLVVSTTQDVHDDIVDLLEQLRRLQDLQVTIEVRFITLSDDFFERIGIDFDFNIEDGDFRTQAQLQNDDRVSPSTTVGFDGATQTFTADLDIPFTQNSFSSAVPTFGGFDPATAAGFGFAILSDIEAFFVIQAAQGNSRTNVLQAPKVTLFNGQTAFVADAVQRPFVTSVIPVVGDFAAAQQPVIAVLSEGRFMTIQAVVSNDRRYVRMTVVPFFSEIGDVQEFTFEGSSTTTTGSSSATDDDGTNTSEENSENTTEMRSGTTVQLPTLAFVTVTTTVNVPDGGTVLLGGIKRKSEGRNEFGVPMLSKIPYVNRLFRNVGIGSETESLMLMVTPRIIIQEEEEQKLLGTGP